MNAPSIERLLAERWGLHALEVTAVGPVWRAVTKEGAFCIKRGKHGVSKLEFHLFAIECLWQRGYEGTPRARKTVSGERYALTDDGPYVVTDWVGRPLDFAMREERLLAAAELARFHAASEAAVLPKGVRPVHFDGKWLRRFPERTQELREFYAGASSAHPFEQEALLVQTTLLPLAEQAEDLLLRSSYEEMVQSIRTTPLLVHGNVKGENFTINPEGRTAIIDFDSFRFDVWVQDLCDLFLTSMPLCEWSDTEALAMFEAYHSIRPVSPDEVRVLLALMSFPYDAYKVIHKYSSQPGRPLAKTMRQWKAAQSEMHQQCDFLQKWACLLAPFVD